MGLFCYPNPATNAFNVVYDSEKEFSGVVRFFDIHGKTLSERTVVFGKGRNIVKIDDLQFLPAGIIHVSGTAAICPPFLRSHEVIHHDFPPI
jgi:hypothetical protein